MSFDPMGLPRFERVLDSYVFCPSVISTRAGTFVTPRPYEVHSTCNCKGTYVHQVPL